MTKTFERFLRAFSDEELIAFARERSKVRPPYWRVMRLALRIEADRRRVRLDEELEHDGLPATPERQAQTGTA